MILEDYKHIELTEDELDDAILTAKMQKERRIEHDKSLALQHENRKRLALFASEFSYDQMKAYFTYRKNLLFQNGVFHKPFVIHKDNQEVIEMLLLYFSRDKKAESMGIDLNKGICLAGVPGCGKSWLMKIFSKNPRQSFYIRDCNDLARDYQTKGASVIDEYSLPIRAAVNDKDNFYKPLIGVCFSDLGVEKVKKSFGNESNVIAEIIFNRYKNASSSPEYRSLVGDLTHIETNLTAEQIEEFYGSRIRSRLRETVNFIQLPGGDMRK